MSAVVYVANTTICTLFTSTSVAKTTAYFMVNHLLLARLYSSADLRRGGGGDADMHGLHGRAVHIIVGQHLDSLG
jgi:hypothetical protein